MASSDILFHTLSSITDIKLDEIIFQRSSFEEGKAKLLKAVELESNQREKVHILLDGIEDLASMAKLQNHHIISFGNVRMFLDQAIHDPSVTCTIQKDWQNKLENELDVQSLRYEYASLYSRLVNEWLSSASEDITAADGSTSKTVGCKEMHDQLQKWEEYVFHVCQIDTNALESYLENLFKSSVPVETAYINLRLATKLFEQDLKTPNHFDRKTLKWVIEGLLASDLLTDEKQKVLRDFLNNKPVLAEVADVLNMRMGSLDKWKLDSHGTPVEIRRQINGRYRFYHDEDLLQTILLRYIGIRWSVFFRRALTEFYHALNVWKPSASAVPTLDEKRRDYFLGPYSKLAPNNGVEGLRSRHFSDEVLLEALTESTDEKRGGYNDDDHDEETYRRHKSGQQITQTLLHTLATEIIMKTRLGHQLTVVRTDFAWFGPSLPHATIFTVLKFFNMSDGWIDFFKTVLEAPMKFLDDGADASVQIRKRGTLISGPVSEMLGETVLFCLDFAFNQQTDGARMYRLHDDIWFWGAEETCVKGWKLMKEFAQLTGLDFNEEKTGSVKIARQAGVDLSVSPSLPKGDVVWGFLKLDAESGRFVIDQKKVDIHIEELRRQLDACKSIFDWIQAWNVYGVRFFSNNFGKPANCYGCQHVEMMLTTFARIQQGLFKETGGSVTSTLKEILMQRFGVKNIPEGYLYFPVSLGGLGLRNPFVNLCLIKNPIAENPDSFMDKFFKKEKDAYDAAKLRFDNGSIEQLRKSNSYNAKFYASLEDEPFMGFEEFTKYREQVSPELEDAYRALLHEPIELPLDTTTEVTKATEHIKGTLTPTGSYQWWIVELYAAEMIRTFGGLEVVDQGLLPVGMVSMFRESRFKWQG